MKTLVIVFCGLALLVQQASAAEPAVRDCVRSRELKDVPLTWRPTSEIVPKHAVVTLPAGASIDAQSGGVASVRIQIDTLIDQRENRNRIGENREDVDQGCVYPVTTKDDVAAFATERLRFLLKKLGLDVVDQGGDVRLTGRILRFFVTETGTYDGEIGLRLDVTGSSGEVLWSGLVNGTNGHWGKSYKLANYDETISDALIDTAQQLAADSGFIKAISQRAPPSQP